MKEKPILFSAPMVRAILEGRKTQTRRVVKPQGAILTDKMARGMGVQPPPVQNSPVIPCPYGKPGGRLWVREGFSGPHYQSKSPPSEWSDSDPIWYWADGNPESGDWTIPKPSIHMPRWASRILLEVTGVRVERLQDISEADCIAEGTAGGHGSIPGYGYAATPQEHYRHIWESINGHGSLEENPWVWVIEFKRIDNA